MKQANKNHPSSPTISEEMKAWSAALGTEVSGWRGATQGAFFGFNALYCHDQMFALLPRTRGVTAGNALAFKLALRPSLDQRLSNDGRIRPMQGGKSCWFTFKMASGSDLHDALEWLSLAYEDSGKKPKD